MSSTVWIAAEAFTTGEPALTLEPENTSHGYTKVTASSTGDAWVFMALRLPALAKVKKVHLQYAVASSANFISQVRLCDTTDVATDTVLFDDAITLQSTTPAIYDSADVDVAFSFAAELELKLTFGNTTDQIKLGAVGIEFDLGVEIDVREYGAIGDGNAEDSTALGNADAAAAAAGCPLLLPRGLYRISNDLTLTSRCHFYGGVLVPDGGHTVTIAGFVDCPPTEQCFEVSGGSVVFDTSNATPAYDASAAWFGCLEGADFTSPLQAAVNAIAAAGSATEIAPHMTLHVPFSGSLSSTIAINDRSVTLVGRGIAGSVGTQLQWTGKSAGPMLDWYNARLCGARDLMLLNASSVSITNIDGTTGVVTTVATGHGLSTGDMIRIQGLVVRTDLNAVWQVTVDTSTTLTLDGAPTGASESPTAATLSVLPHGMQITSEEPSGWAGLLEFERVWVGTWGSKLTSTKFNCGVNTDSPPSGASGYQVRFRDCGFHECLTAIRNGSSQQLQWEVNGCKLAACNVAIETASQMLERNSYHVHNGCEYSFIGDDLTGFNNIAALRGERVHIEHSGQLVKGLAWFWLDLESGAYQIDDLPDNPLVIVDTSGDYEQRVRLRDFDIQDLRSDRTVPVEVRMLLPTSSAVTRKKSFEFSGWAPWAAGDSVEDGLQFVFRDAGTQSGGESTFAVSWQRESGGHRNVNALLHVDDVTTSPWAKKLSDLPEGIFVHGEQVAIGTRWSQISGVGRIRCASTRFPVSGAGSHVLSGALPAGTLVLGVTLGLAAGTAPFSGDLGISGNTTLWASGYQFAPNSTAAQFTPGAHMIVATGTNAMDAILTTTASLPSGSNVNLTVFYLEMEGAF